MKRNATAVWLGTGKEGSGKLSTGSTLLNNAQYSWKSRFEDGVGTNPEELIAAAHAGCFSMKLAFVLVAAGFPAESIETKCENQLANGAVEFHHLICKAKVPGISAQAFQKAAEEAKIACPISKVLNTNITMEASLI